MSFFPEKPVIFYMSGQDRHNRNTSTPENAEPDDPDHHNRERAPTDDAEPDNPDDPIHDITRTTTPSSASSSRTEAIVGGDFGIHIAFEWMIMLSTDVAYTYSNIGSRRYALMLKTTDSAPNDTRAFVSQSLALIPGRYIFSMSARYRRPGFVLRPGRVEVGVYLLAGGVKLYSQLTTALPRYFKVKSTEFMVPEGTTHGLLSIILSWIEGSGEREVEIDWVSMERTGVDESPVLG